MTRGRPLISLLAASAGVALVASACGGGGGGTKTSTEKSATSGKPGGTLTLLMSADFEHLDPARNYVSGTLNFGRMIYRTLTTYKAVPGPAGNQIVGDLATDTAARPGNSPSRAV